MIREMLSIAAAGLLLIGCAGNARVEQQDPASRRLNVGWIRHDWRTCEEDGSCPRPTPKTVALPAPMPMASTPQAPLAANDSDQGRAANRRVEIHFTTTQKEIVR